jgi:hypothetical protein
MKLLEDGPKYGPKYAAVINSYIQLDLFIMKYLLC